MFDQANAAGKARDEADVFWRWLKELTEKGGK